MDVMKVALLVLNIVSTIFQWMKNSQLLDAGGVQLLAIEMRGRADDLHKVEKAVVDAGKRFDDAAATGGVPADLKVRDD